MFTVKVDYYSQISYRKYIENRKEEGIYTLTIPLLELHQNEIDDLLIESEVDIDLTSAVKLSKVNDTINYILEKIIYLIVDKNVNFIIEEKYLEELLNTIPNFVKGEKVDLDILEETLEEKDISNNSKRLIINDAIKIDELKMHLNRNIVGHEAFKETLLRELEAYKYFNMIIEDQPILSVFLLGPSGTGKTEIGRVLHKYLDEINSVAKINLANYKSESSLSGLIGSPPGYIGSKEESDLVRKIKVSNAGVLIIDEFEKADSAIHNFFLQLLEEGKFDDAVGNVHNLNGYIIIFTSNFSKNEYLEKVPPELRSRFNLVFECAHLKIKQREEYLERIFHEYSKKVGVKLDKSELENLILTTNVQKEKNLRILRQKARKAFYELKIGNKN
ncbi:Heat shock protein HSP1 [Solibacillus isronensis B3W22]|uniref:Heat shock protein HSP1 n=1 Tax=Solibacillus isronensis B3W22 TaxID=1224748 RepID=K1L403_9BACL|nr:AAA family ATPase [Solibacillus isronensis]AMO87251.1 hypothetical protein SOLI23_17365 [Solibacillus silvestris]EKB45343.1 Heat shock protein HSP1 [Solibacillus isronensis B3W22]